MRPTLEDFHPRNRRDLPWIASNIVLAVIGAVLIAVEWASITAHQAETLGKENRFLTTEWYLLQQLRAQTDAELTRKNQEIASLRRLYEQLKAEDNSPSELDTVETLLKAAEVVREEMLAESVKSGFHPSLSAVMPADTGTPPVPGTDVRSRHTVALLQQQADGLRARAEIAEAAAEDLRRRLSLAAQPGVPLARAVGALENGKNELGPTPQATVAELTTRALIRALLSSADIKRQYPDLLVDFDAYLDAYGTREYARGRAAGYTEAAQAVQDLAR